MNSLNLEQARHNMIEQQLRPMDIHDDNVLNAMQSVPREEYVPMEYRQLAYADMEIPLGSGETMLSPGIEGRLLQALDIQPDDDALVIGTGSGYLTAVISMLANRVTSIDINSELAEEAQHRLKQHKIENVSIVVGDATRGLDDYAPYDVIAITGSMTVIPQLILENLRVGGRLFAVTGDAPAMHAQLITRKNANSWETSDLFDTELAPLENGMQVAPFSF
ncbi:MAG: methyltransferase domain-containing protein [Gammaproteobacteria bacterium]|nr:methyltransferase domain-containing protein [Gammaproteobacteria bacterium]